MSTPLTDAQFNRLDADSGMDNHERFEAMTEHAKGLERTRSDLLDMAKMAVKWADQVPAPYRDWPFIQAARAVIAKEGL